MKVYEIKIVSTWDPANDISVFAELEEKPTYSQIRDFFRTYLTKLGYEPGELNEFEVMGAYEISFISSEKFNKFSMEGKR